jgi:hypothetical protein
MNKPEQRLGAEVSRSDQQLAECLGGTPGRENEAWRARLAGFDWQGVANAAVRHGLRPLLYERLAAKTPDLKVPESVLESLRETYLAISLRNALLYRDLKGVLEAFRKNGIAVIVLKGAHLAQLVYPTTASRQMADIDMLVKPRELAKAAVTLLENGYGSEIRPDDIETWRAQHPNAHHLPSFAKPLHPRIELHWTISAASNSGKPPDVWEESRSVRIAGVEGRVLSPEDLLIHLCLHSRLHRFGQGLRPVCDLTVAIRRYQGELDWNKVISRARAWQAEKCVHLGLWLGRKLMRAPVPASVFRALQPNGLEASWADLAVEIVLGGDELRPETEYALQIRDRRLRWGGAASLAGKMRFLGRKLFPGRDHMAGYMAQKHSLPLGPPRNYACHIVRALDLMGVSLRLAKQAALGQSPETARRLRWNEWLDGVAS